MGDGGVDCREDWLRAGVPTEVADKLKALERENRELRQADEILRKASACFAQHDVFLLSEQGAVRTAEIG